MFHNLQLNNNEAPNMGLHPITLCLVGFVITSLCVVMIFAVMSTPKASPTLAELAKNNIELSGVENPVTAVLLNFRSYDTLLEIAVLLIVAIAIFPIRSGNNVDRPFLAPTHHSHTTPVMAGLLKWLVPFAIIVGGYLLWTGAFAPGGAFQAGAVIAGAGVALSLMGQHKFNWQTKSVRVFLTIGLLTFVVIAGLNAALTGTTLQYPTANAGFLILIIEIAATASIASILLLLFVCMKTMGTSPAAEGS